ncbi:hypothetical protein P9112_003574 [Eukaryota sp. TZLM1-RC]
MKADLTNHVKECAPCQKTAPVPSSFISSTGSVNSAHRPFEYLNCDCIGPLPLDVTGSKYVIHFVDAFSQFCILVPSRDLKAQSIVDALLVHVYSIFGAPKAIHSDNGPELANQIFSLFCSYLKIEHSPSIPHFHQSNGLVERQHLTFLQALRKLLLDFSDYDNWSHYVPICQMIINSQTRSSLHHLSLPADFRY